MLCSLIEPVYLYVIYSFTFRQYGKEQGDLKMMSRETESYTHPFESLEDELMEPLNPHDSGQIPGTGNRTPRSQIDKPFETRPPLPLPNAATFSAIMDLSWLQR